ncbi:MAG: TonB-dependent receptor [Gammaproteobacteria bacterium]|nr:TonB-dependent receptor [Gammaproteobacteria bacterium]
MKIANTNKGLLKIISIGMLGFTVTTQAEDLGLIQVESSTIADRFENKRSEPSNIGIISGEQVDDAHAQNIQQLLQSIPGVTTEVQSGDSLKIHIRGIENQVFMGEKPGVAVVIDGVPVFERTGKVNIDLDNIESIKVIKGGASYLFGDDALSGAVIITTKRGAKYKGYKVAAEVGSFGYNKELARAGFANEDASGHVQITHRETDGYYDDSDSESDYINGKLQYYINDSSDITLGFESANRLKNSHGTVDGVTAAANDPKSTDPIYNDYANNYDVDLQKIFTTYSTDIGANDNLMVNLYQFTDETDYNSSPRSADESLYNYFNDYDQQQRGLKTEYRSGGDKFAWMAAADLRDNSYDNKVTYLDCADFPWNPGCAVGSLSEDNNTDEQVQAVYGEVKFQTTQDLTLTANGRYDQIELDYTDNLDATDNGTKDFNVSSWRLGANYALQDDMDLYGNLSTGFRAPTVTQLFVGSNTPSRITAANPDLEEETATNMEIGLRTSTKWGDTPVEVDLAIFQIEREDYIQASAGQYTTGTDSSYENIGDIQNRGLELSLLGTPNNRFNWEVNYTLLHAKYTDYSLFNLQTEPVAGVCPPGSTPVLPPFGPPIPSNCLTAYNNTDNEVPRTPRHHLNVYLNNKLGDNWLITTEIDYSSSYYADEINQEKISGHTVVNLLANYARKMGTYNWSFFARIDNLLDEDYYNTARGFSDSNEDGVYDAEDLSLVVNQGISFITGVEVNF